MINNDVFEADMCSALKAKYKLRIEKSCFSMGAIPNYLLLDSTRNIHSYIEFCRINGNDLESAHWDKKNQLRGIINVLRTQFSQLDRPLFFIFKDQTGCFQTIEGSAVREHLLEERDAEISSYIIANADKFQDILPKIFKEL